MTRIEGVVVHGLKNGRTFGFPTANLDLSAETLSPFGIYAAWVHVLDGPFAGEYPGCASIGTRPTIGDHIPNLEVHLLDFEGDLYGCCLAVDLIAYQRDEVKFDSVEAMIAQMHDDIARTRAVLSRQTAASRATGATSS